MRNSEPVPICAPRLHQAPLPLPLQKHINDAMLKPDQMDAMPSQQKVSLTTTLITKLLTIRSHSRSPRRTRRTTRQPQRPSTTQADCRWHGRGQGFESPKLHSLFALVRSKRIGVISALCLGSYSTRGGAEWGARWPPDAP